MLLADLDADDSRQPYHAELERGARIGAAVVKRARADAARRARKALEALLGELQLAGLSLRAAGLVIGSDVDPLTLGNLHIRAHALEGRFYREALERSAVDLGLQTFTLLERDAFARVPQRLAKSPAEVRRVLGDLGAAAGRPWRRDEQLAAMAAWVALAS